MFILFILFIITFNCNSLEQTKNRYSSFCVNCRHFIKNDAHPLLSKCGAFQKIEKSPFYLILGDKYLENSPLGYKYYTNQFISCNPPVTIARLLPHLCGTDGKEYEELDRNTNLDSIDQKDEIDTTYTKDTKDTKYTIYTKDTIDTKDTTDEKDKTNR